MVKMKKRIKEISLQFGLVCLTVILTIFCLELIFYMKSKPEDTSRKTFRHKYEVVKRDGYKDNLDLYQKERRHKLGRLYEIFSETKHQMYFGDEILWEKKYTTDQLGRRITGVEEKRKYHLLFFGGSYVFGDGLDDNATLPYLVSQKNSSIHSYNYGNSGSTTSHMYVQLQNFIESDQILEKLGAAIYVYNDFHIDRNIGAMFPISWNEGNAPYLFIDENNELVADGKFYSNRYFTTQLYKLLNNSYTLRYFKVNLPLTSLTPRAFFHPLLFKIIKSSFEIYKEKFQSDNFIVLIYPGNTGNEKLIDFLRENNIKYFDYSKLFDGYDLSTLRYNDGHPNLKANELVASTILKDLSLYLND